MDDKDDKRLVIIFFLINLHSEKVNLIGLLAIFCSLCCWHLQAYFEHAATVQAQYYLLLYFILFY